MRAHAHAQIMFSASCTQSQAFAVTDAQPDTARLDYSETNIVVVL